MDEILMDRIGIDGVNGLVEQSQKTPRRRISRNVARSAANVKRQPIYGSQKPTSQKSRTAFMSSSKSLDPSFGRDLEHTYGDEDNDNRHLALLREQGFSTGLAKALASNTMMFQSRIWIVDNSGSMEIGDGHRIVTTCDRKVVAQQVSRWEELRDTVCYHAEMAVLLHSPTWFKLLNHPGPGFEQQDFKVCYNPSSNPDQDLRSGRLLMQRVKPTGTTPLAEHVWMIQKHIHQMAPQLRRDGQQVVVVLATDGIPTDCDGYVGDDVDAEFLNALQSLAGLPVWLVIRLCTDEEKVAQYYNSLDQKLELSLEVLDDFFGEAKEVRRHNKWLNYCLPMHRCRELGYHNRVFDFLDERPLTKGELRDFCSVLFGAHLEDIPDPTTDWRAFLDFVQAMLLREEQQFDPMVMGKRPWINIKALHRCYGKGKCTVS